MIDDSKIFRAAQWVDEFAERLAAQLSVQAVIEEQIAVEYGSLVFGEALTPELQRALYVTVLERASAQLAGTEPQATERWRELVDAQHEYVEIVLESVSMRLLISYEDYLDRYWAPLLSRVEWLPGLLSEHVSALRVLLEQGHSGQALLDHLGMFERAWAQQVS
ncbi:hypothetical protein JYG34_22920 [Pseudomonas entomophila]|uniref:hypothetical protein n=1 Tax=Pseudomonas entomophila TaxID=312306 RepID=UPI001BCFC96C|nr:hypothetical protein [Pseudomonas entomophila]QVM90820.1 hypothetical protein JYG34_22920 [Pseudomonas entomophila]